MKLIFISIFCLASLLCYSQDLPFTYPEFLGKNLSEIEMDKNWLILDKVSGHLNSDNTQDTAIVLESKDSVYEKDCDTCKLNLTKARILIVLLSSKDKLRTTIQNNIFIARDHEGGMAPHISPELYIENHLLTIYYQYTRSSQSYTFAHDHNKLTIINAISSGVSGTGFYEGNTFDFVAMEILEETGSIEEDILDKRIIPIIAKPKSLSDFQRMYDWEVAENKFL